MKIRSPRADEIVELLYIRNALRKGQNINAPDSSGETYLHRVAERENIVIAAALIHATEQVIPPPSSAFNADVNAQNSNGDTPLHIAVAGKESTENSQFVAYLLQSGADATITNNAGLTAIQVAKKHDKDAQAAFLRQEVRTIQLCQACEDGIYHHVTTLLQDRLVDINRPRLRDGKTPLELAQANDRRLITQLLLSHGAKDPTLPQTMVMTEGPSSPLRIRTPSL